MSDNEKKKWCICGWRTANKLGRHVIVRNDDLGAKRGKECEERLQVLRPTGTPAPQGRFFVEQRIEREDRWRKMNSCGKTRDQRRR